MKRFPAMRFPVVGAVLVCASLGCRPSPFEGLEETVSAEIANADTTMFQGESAVFSARAVYRLGPGLPHTVVWATDTSMLGVVVFGNLSASVEAKQVGATFLYALINDEFLDSVLVTVVGLGAVRWRAALGGAPALHPAIGADSNVVVSSSGANPRLSLYSPAGNEIFAVPTCGGVLGPSATGGGFFTTGAGCTDRHDVSGAATWSVPFGDLDAGVAVAANGDVVVLHATPDGQTPDVIVLSRISAAGVELWRDTLRAAGRVQESAPAIAANGEIYVPWRTPDDSTWLSRVGGDGTVRWTVPSPAPSPHSSPALAGARIVLTHLGGVTVFDTAGSVVWTRAFSDDLASADAATQASAPVVDVAGGIYAQTEVGLVAYLAGGQTRWATDSVGFGNTGSPVGAPVLLLDGTMVMPCQGEVCGVRVGTGARVWRSAMAQGTAESVAVGLDGTVYVTVRTASGGDLVALWTRAAPDVTAWHAAGGSMARTRRQPL